MGRFWINDNFIRLYAKNLTAYEQMVYVALCSYANKDAVTFVGCRKISENLRYSKNTVNKAIKKLEASHWIRRLDRNIGRPSHIKIYAVPNDAIQPSHQMGHKEYPKESFKEEDKINNRSNEINKGSERLLEEFKRKNAKAYREFIDKLSMPK